jgi:hypothetical protein
MFEFAPRSKRKFLEVSTVAFEALRCRRRRMAGLVLAGTLSMLIVPGLGLVEAWAAPERIAPLFWDISRTTGAATNPRLLDNGSAYEALDCRAPAPGKCFAVADRIIPDDDDDLLTIVDVADLNHKTNQTNVGTGTGTRHMDAIAYLPSAGVLYAVDSGQFGKLNTSTGKFSAIGTGIGKGKGSEGEISFDNIDGLAFDLSSGALYASLHRGGPDLLLRIDPSTGEHVSDAFGSDDYVVIEPIGGKDDVDDMVMEDGVLYATMNNSGFGGILAKVNTSTGKTTEIGPHGVNTVEGLSVDRQGRFFGIQGSPGVGQPVPPPPPPPPPPPALPVTGPYEDIRSLAFLGLACLLVGALALGRASQISPKWTPKHRHS